MIKIFIFVMLFTKTVFLFFFSLGLRFCFHTRDTTGKKGEWGGEGQLNVCFVVR